MPVGSGGEHLVGRASQRATRCDCFFRKLPLVEFGIRLLEIKIFFRDLNILLPAFASSAAGSWTITAASASTSSELSVIDSHLGNLLGEVISATTWPVCRTELSHCGCNCGCCRLGGGCLCLRWLWCCRRSLRRLLRLRWDGRLRLLPGSWTSHCQWHGYSVVSLVGWLWYSRLWRFSRGARSCRGRLRLSWRWRSSGCLGG